MPVTVLAPIAAILALYGLDPVSLLENTNKGENAPAVTSLLCSARPIVPPGDVLALLVVIIASGIIAVLANPAWLK